MKKLIIRKKNGKVVEITLADTGHTTAEILWEGELNAEPPQNIKQQVDATKAQEAAEEAQEREVANAHSYLAQTDWYVLRFVEKSIPIPANIRALRDAARTKADRT